MRAIAKWPNALMMVTLCSGCISSVNPLASPEVLDDNPALVGIWFEEPKSPMIPGTLSLSISRAENGYVLVADSKEHSKRYSAKLVRLGEHSFLDVCSESVDFDSIPAHHIFRVHIGENKLVIEPIDQVNLERVLRREESELPVTRLNKGRRLVLTGSTDQLQTFFQTHADELYGKFGGRQFGSMATTFRHRLN